MEAWEGARAVGGDEEGSLRQYFVIILVFVLCVDIYMVHDVIQQLA